MKITSNKITRANTAMPAVPMTRGSREERANGIGLLFIGDGPGVDWTGAW
jgi:hypothetical protein